MKKLIYFLSLIFISTTAMAGEDDFCFSVSLDGKKISHIVVYLYDWDHQTPGFPAPTINVRVFNYLDTTMIVGTVIDQNVLDQWQGQYVYPGPNLYPANHKVLFSEADRQGKKTLYEISINGQAQDMGGGISVLRGKSVVKIDGKVVQFPNLKTIRYCPNPADPKEIKEIESQL